MRRTWRPGSLLLIAALAAPLGMAADKKPLADKQPAFHISTIHTGQVIGQTVLSAFLDDTEYANLLIVTVGEDNQRNLGLFKLSDGQYQAQPEFQRNLDSDVILMDVGRIGKQEILATFTRDKVWHYDPYTGRRRELISMTSIYGAAIFGSIPKMDLFKDLNGDGLDDFIIPDFEGFQVYIQDENKGFVGPVSVFAPPLVEMSYNDYPWYQPRQSFLSDMTLDGKKDLIFWVDDEFSVFSQDLDGTFGMYPTRIKSSV
jgi:hypothetical protein